MIAALGRYFINRGHNQLRKRHCVGADFFALLPPFFGHVISKQLDFCQQNISGWGSDRLSIQMNLISIRGTGYRDVFIKSFHSFGASDSLSQSDFVSVSLAFESISCKKISVVRSCMAKVFAEHSVLPMIILASSIFCPCPP